jgi:acyl-CoA thioester hydrolase
MRRERWSRVPPRFLESSSTVRVRFQEVDALRVVWHGHYLAYFEEGRTALGREYGIDYPDLLRAGILAPLVHVEVDYFSPARMGEVLRIRSRLHPDDGAWLTFTYLISREDGTRLAAGKSVQAFTDPDGTLILTKPPFYREFLERWTTRMVEG